MILPSLSENERLIADYLLSIGEKISDLKIAELANKFNISEAMIVKLSHKLGYQGYRDLKKSLMEYSKLPVVDLHQELNPKDSNETVLKKVFKTAIQAIEETLAVMDIQRFTDAVEVLSEAGQIEFYGVGGSAALAMDASHKFLRIGKRSNTYSDTHLMCMSASLLTSNDVVIAISHSGQTKSLIDAVLLAKTNGAKAIVITNYKTSPLAEIADITLYSTSQGSPITGENSASRIAQLNIIDALFVCIAQKTYETSLNNLEKTIVAVKGKKV
jgi:RpiR family transcriptional regulator, repressor of rpiB and als operon